MNADAFRYLYGYHFAENRKMWDEYILPLSQEQFTQPLSYSHGSVRNQVLHLISADQSWFCELRGVEVQPDLKPADFDDRVRIREYWDRLEGDMYAYLDGLRDEMLFLKPFPGEDQNLIVWQVLLHVVNHATDHRAQLLRQLNDLGIKTKYQDFIFYVYDHP